MKVISWLASPEKGVSRVGWRGREGRGHSGVARTGGFGAPWVAICGLEGNAAVGEFARGRGSPWWDVDGEGGATV
ncbi:hypothetical protein TIFTF001_021678 [Ficus carica]|uniref:Uncharacterized protein n=1 Tax=Ficus carica TaxID=3494 RepID=A0AA88AV41_FICCA|nr:hypothetical protein TIFTF001_021678 [Ficus carica]